MLSPHSLVRQTILVVLGAELLCVLAFSVTALEHERHTRRHAFDAMLKGRSDSVLATIQDAEDPADPLRMDDSEVHPQAGDAYAVYNLDGGLVSSSPNAPSALIQRKADGFSDEIVHGHPYRILQRSAARVLDRSDTNSPVVRRVTILYAANTEHIGHEIREAAAFYFAVSLVGFLLTTLILVVLLRRILHPIQELADKAAAVSVSAPQFEAPASALRLLELRPLAQTLTTAITGLRLALAYERNFVGDAAHELKTAVAVVRSSIQLLMLRSRSREEYARGLEVLLKDNRRVEDLVEQMLLLARMEERGREVELTDLAIPAATVVSTLTNYAEMRGVHLLLDAAGDAFTGMSPEKAEVLLSNLLTNAIQHSPHGSQVEVRCRVEDKTVLLQVEDHGAGISAAALPHVYERFLSRGRLSQPRNRRHRPWACGLQVHRGRSRGKHLHCEYGCSRHYSDA